MAERRFLRVWPSTAYGDIHFEAVAYLARALREGVAVLRMSVTAKCVVVATE